MAVSKRLRYEILRRDNHTCRYCGASAPDVPLRVDHVTPVALGGTDTPDNLATACEPCNSGKSSASPDATHVAAVSDDALRWAKAMERAAANLLEQETPKLEYRDAFLTEWNRWHVGKDETKKIPLPNDWKQSVERFRVAGIPVWMWAEIVDIGMGNDKVKNEAKFKYCAGVAWKKTDELQQEARRIASLKTATAPSRQSTLAAIVSAWIGSYTDQYGIDPTTAMTDQVRDLAEAGLDVGVKAEDLLNGAVAGGACGESVFGLFMREDPEFLAEVDEAYQVWRHCWTATGAAAPDGFDIGCFKASVSQAMSLDYTQYQIVQQAARTGAARGIDLVEDLKAARTVAAGGEN
jgi:hypothetical protein